MPIDYDKFAIIFKFCSHLQVTKFNRVPRKPPTERAIHVSAQRKIKRLDDDLDVANVLLNMSSTDERFSEVNIQSRCTVCFRITNNFIK